MARRKRAALALWSLAIAGFFGADLIGYGSDEGYKVGFAGMVISGLVLFATTLFAINVATYKRR
jgi:uncharacterized membrane protein